MPTSTSTPRCGRARCVGPRVRVVGDDQVGAVGRADVGERGAIPLGAVGQHHRSGGHRHRLLLHLGVAQVERRQPGVEAERARAQYGDVEPQRTQRGHVSGPTSDNSPLPRLTARHQQPDPRGVDQFLRDVQRQRHHRHRRGRGAAWRPRGPSYRCRARSSRRPGGARRRPGRSPAWRADRRPGRAANAAARARTASRTPRRRGRASARPAPPGSRGRGGPSCPRRRSLRPVPATPTRSTPCSRSTITRCRSALLTARKLPSA